MILSRNQNYLDFLGIIGAWFWLGHLLSYMFFPIFAGIIASRFEPKNQKYLYFWSIIVGNFAKFTSLVACFFNIFWHHRIDILNENQKYLHFVGTIVVFNWRGHVIRVGIYTFFLCFACQYVEISNFSVEISNILVKIISILVDISNILRVNLTTFLSTFQSLCAESQTFFSKSQTLVNV